jgi:hypothetical protein
MVGGKFLVASDMPWSPWGGQCTVLLTISFTVL